MLKTPTPFPQQGSYALLPEGRETHLVRIIQKYDRDTYTEALVSFPLASTSPRRVPLDALQDGTDLTPAERRERDELRARRADKERLGERVRGKWADRLAALDAHAGNARLMRSLLDQHEAHLRAAANGQPRGGSLAA
jgi:hypothetical protein